MSNKVWIHNLEYLFKLYDLDTPHFDERINTITQFVFVIFIVMFMFNQPGDLSFLTYSLLFILIIYYFNSPNTVENFKPEQQKKLHQHQIHYQSQQPNPQPLPQNCTLINPNIHRDRPLDNKYPLACPPQDLPPLNTTALPSLYVKRLSNMCDNNKPFTLKHEKLNTKNKNKNPIQKVKSFTSIISKQDDSPLKVGIPVFKCDESDSIECNSDKLASFKCGDNNGVPDETDIINMTNMKYQRLKNMSLREQTIIRNRERSEDINNIYDTSYVIRNSHIKPGEKCKINPHLMSMPF